MPLESDSLEAAAELREHHRDHVLLDAARRQVGLERGQGARERGQLRILPGELIAVRVEAAPVDRDHARAEAGREQRRRQLQLRREAAVGRIADAGRPAVEAREPVGDVDGQAPHAARAGEVLVALRSRHGRELADLAVDVAGHAGHRESDALQTFERAHGRRQGADLLGQVGVERDRLQRVGLGAVGVEPAAQPAGLQLRERTCEPVVAALEVRAVGRVVVGGRDDREIRADAAGAVAVERVEALGVEVAIGPGAGYELVRERQRAAGVGHDRGADRRAHAVAEHPRDRGPQRLVLGVLRRARGHEAVEAVVAAVEVDHDEALLHRLGRLGDCRLPDLLERELGRPVDGREAEHAVAQQLAARDARRARGPVAPAGERIRRDRQDRIGLQVGDGAVGAGAVGALERLDLALNRHFTSPVRLGPRA